MCPRHDMIPGILFPSESSQSVLYLVRRSPSGKRWSVVTLNTYLLYLTSYLPTDPFSLSPFLPFSCKVHGTYSKSVLNSSKVRGFWRGLKHDLLAPLTNPILDFSFLIILRNQTKHPRREGRERGEKRGIEEENLSSPSLTTASCLQRGWTGCSS